MDIHHITWWEGKNQYKVRTIKLKWGNLVPFYVHLQAQILVHLQVQQILIALYAVDMMLFENLLSDGAFYTSKSKLNIEHVMKLTINWRDIAIYISSNPLAKRLMIGDLGANSSFYHKCHSTNLYNWFTKKQKEECEGKIAIDHVKAAPWEKAIAFMNETC